MKSRLREAFAIGAVVGGAAFGVGVAVAATSPDLLSSPESVAGPGRAADQLSPALPQVLGYTILRPSSLTVDTAAGLQVLVGTGMQVTGLAGLPGLDLVSSEPAEKEAVVGSALPAPKHAAPPAPPAPVAPAPARATGAPEPDFPGRGEEHRSERADPQRSDRAAEQAETLSQKDSGERKQDD